MLNFFISYTMSIIDVRISTDFSNATSGQRERRVVVERNRGLVSPLKGDSRVH